MDAVWKAFEDSSLGDSDFGSTFPSALGFSSTRLGERLAPASAPSFDLVRITGNDQFDAEAIRNFFVSYLSSLPENCGDLNSMRLQWSADRSRAEAVEILYGTFQNVFLHNPHLFRMSGNPPKVFLVSGKVAVDSVAEDELLSVATSVTSQLFSQSPDLDSQFPVANPTFTTKRRAEEDFDEKDGFVKCIMDKLKQAPDQQLKKDELGSDLVKNDRKNYDQICDLWGSLQDMLLAYPDLFVVSGDIPGKEVIKIRTPDEESKELGDKRIVNEAVKSVLKRNYSIMHPDDLRDELHRTKPMIMGLLGGLYGGFTQLLAASSSWLEVVDDPKLLTPPFVRLRWPAFCAICGVWPETPEAWQGHVFSEKHKDMRRSVIRLKDGRDPDRWPVLRMIEERIRRAGGKMKLSVIPNFGKNRPLFATYVRKLYGGFKQLVESNPRFKVSSEDGSADPVVSLVDDWRRDRLEGVVIRVKQKDTLIWIRPDTNPNIEFFLHKDRSLGGREIANSPAFVVPRVGDRMSFLPSDVPADPNPFAEGAVVLESVPDLRLRFSGVIVHHDRDRYLLRAEFQTAAGAQESGDLFEVIWRDETARMAVNAGQTRVNFVRSCRPYSGNYPYADDVTVDNMPPPRQISHQPQYNQQAQGGYYMQQPHHHHHHHHQQGMGAPQHAPPQQSFAFTSDATFRGRPAQDSSLTHSAASIENARGRGDRGRFQTWPVAVFDPSAAGGTKGDSTPPSGGSTSGERSAERSPQAPVRDSRTPLKLNPSKPIVEFSFRGASTTTTSNPSSTTATNPTLSRTSGSSSSSASPRGLKFASPRAINPVVVPSAEALKKDSKEFSVKLDLRNDEADLLTLLSPQVLELVRAKAPNFAKTLVSVAMDVGALPVLSFVDGSCIRGEHLVSQEEVKDVISKVGNLGVEGSSVVRHSLHLCSTITHPISKEMMGYTLKVGRAVIGLADVLAGVVEGHASVLVLGEFCTGKTVLLRDMARRQSADVSKKLVAVVDTNGELGGAADGKSHSGLGMSRCVRCVKKGHLPDAVDSTVGRHGIASVIVDGICNAESVSALLRTRRRGVGVICSIGAASLAAAACDEVFRPLLSRQPGGRKVAYVKPPFDVAIELRGIGKWIIHQDINASCDALLNKQAESVVVTRVTVDSSTGDVKWVKSLYPSEKEIEGDIGE